MPNQNASELPDILVSEFMDKVALEDFPEAWRVRYEPSLVDDRPRLMLYLARARALIVRNRTQVDSELLAAAPNLVAVGRLGVGLDNIDLDACTARGIEVLPATGANTLSVAEYVLSTALQLARPSYTSNLAMIAGQWPRNALIGGELSGRTMGLVGFGEIARAVADRARALGMRIAAYDPFLDEADSAWNDAENCSFESLLGKADILSLHVPLTPQTRGLIDATAIARMKNDAILINTARGGVVDENMLANALRGGQLGGAALDVFESEPLTADAGAVFAGLSNIILTPHIAGVTVEGNVRVSYLTVENVRRVLEAKQ